MYFTLRVNLHVNVKSTRLHHKPFIYFLFWFWKIENYTPFCHGSMSFSITMLQWSGFRHCQKFMSSWLSFLDIFQGEWKKNLLYIGTWLYFFLGNVSIKAPAINVETFFMSWRWSTIKEVNDWNLHFYTIRTPLSHTITFILDSNQNHTNA